MSYRATQVSDDPVGYFVSPGEGQAHLRVADVVVRANKNPREIFSKLIRLATQSPFSHSALIYLVADPQQGFDNTFLVEAVTKGIRVTSWRNELTPFKQFSVGILRPRVDWYVEAPGERACHNPCDAEDITGIAYLRQVRGIALDQIDGLYDHTAVHELMGLYAQRIAQRFMSKVPAIADALGNIVKQLESKDQKVVPDPVLRFICSGLVQYSFFEALRRQILKAMAEPGGHDAAMSNLRHLPCVLFRDDPDGLVEHYVEQMLSGAQELAAPVPEPILDLLKTATPADFAASPNLDWRYVVLAGAVWQIEPAPEGYEPGSEAEATVLQLVEPKAQAAQREQVAELEQDTERGAVRGANKSANKSTTMGEQRENATARAGG